MGWESVAKRRFIPHLCFLPLWCLFPITRVRGRSVRRRRIGGAATVREREREREREWLLRVSGKEKKKMSFITIMPPIIRAKICKNATGHLNSISIQPKTPLSYSRFVAFEYHLNTIFI